ncbi:LysR family transcriptional regulator [Devosia sp. BK]|uniref:LysR family transcriptional regulator n=1 Tax=Devosia sp. BK TaxID=2871706 RepID=UPI00293A685C|nr:LysR family transcriptional regulator [Devosia sp. BK]MDV3252910.1 LysR family transcriptional regulator [Devosia sp. BK]
MDYRADIDWNQMRALLATVEAGSLSAAARKLGLTQPTLGRQVAALEKSLGVTLFERAGRNLILTQAGRELVGPLQRMGEASAAVTLVASRQSQAVEGLVRITTSDVYAQFVLPPVLEKIRRVAPGLVIDVLASNEVEDLIRRRADIAIRHVPPSEPEVIARRLPDAMARIYGAEKSVTGLAQPVGAETLSKAEFIGFSESIPVLMAELRRHGIDVSEANFPLMTNSGIVAWDWVRRGLGLGVMMETVARMTPGVVDAWPDFAGVPVPTWLATHRELRTARRIRVVFDALADGLGQWHHPPPN